MIVSASHVGHLHISGFMLAEKLCSVQSSEVRDLIKYLSKSEADRHTCLSVHCIILGKQTKLPTDPVIQQYYILIRRFMLGLRIFFLFTRSLRVAEFMHSCF